MSHQGINQQVEAYDQWRRGIAREISQYLAWLRANQLGGEEIEERLARKLRTLQDDSLTVAFVGEYSRGKTELINALFFAEFGQRMLPSQAGRTTMCPSEIYFDPAEGSTLKLLPIDTRVDDRPLSDYRDRPEAWIVRPIDLQSPAEARANLEQLARTQSVSFDRARQLGFDVGSLDPDPEKPGHALVPAWRHALISLDHPVLRQGLRILDTPGLNALGSEPELTIRMIPAAQAVVFLLGADTGVTASDMAIWSEHLGHTESGAPLLRFAVLNKIDMFWDDLLSDSQVQSMIETMRRRTADQLQLEVSAVLPVSAKQALIGRIKGDADRVQRSGITALEDLISQKILTQKEKWLSQNLVSEVLGMLQASLSILTSRLESLRERHETLEARGVSDDFLRELTDRTQADYNFYYKKLFTLRSSRRLMKSQGLILERLISLEQFERHAHQTREELVNSWTSVGMGRAMIGFFNALDNDLGNLRHEIRLAQKMVDSIYQRYEAETRARSLRPPSFNINRQLRELEGLRTLAERFKSRPSTLLSEQSIVVKRFFNTLVAEARRLYAEISEEARRWPEEALLPLMQNTIEQKQTLEHQIRRLKELNASARDIRTQQRKMEAMIEDLRRQLRAAEQIQRRLRKPAPRQLTQKVVNLPGRHARS